MRRFTEEQKQFLTEYVPGHRVKEVAEEFNRRYNDDLKPSSVKGYKRNRGLKSGTPCGYRKGEHRKIWTKEIEEFIRRNIEGKGVPITEGIQMVNREFGTDYTARQLSSFMCNNKICSGYDSRYKKGKQPNATSFQKGNHYGTCTEFKVGNIPHNVTEIGTVRERDGMKWIKTGRNGRDWKPLHRYIYEQAHGEIPKGMYVVALDGDYNNISIDNLRLANKRETASFTGSNHSKNKEIAEVQLNIVKLKMLTRKDRNERSTEKREV